MRGSSTTRRGALRRVGLAHLAEHGLGALLDARVEREREVLAGLRALDLDHADRLAERVLHEPALAVLAAQRLVLRVLEARQPDVVGADAARAPARPGSPAGRCASAR